MRMACGVPAMFSMAVAFCGLATILPAVAAAQTEAQIDSLIDHYIEHGVASSWRPGMVFSDCPRLSAAQEYAFRRLSTEDLPADRAGELALFWIPALRTCADPRIEQWYISRFDRAVARATWRSYEEAGTRTALRVANSPVVREYLHSLATDLTQPMDLRNFAGGLLFERLDDRERLRRYITYFQAGTLPVQTGWLYASKLMQGDAIQLVNEIAAALRRNPTLGEQYAFAQLVHEVRTGGSNDQRTRLADAIRDARGSPTLGERGRFQLTIYERSLRQQIR